ncbi:PKD domain-containing protein [Nocardioides sp. GCM10027113]|uniref:PKD domain-containing protein n=1 Tax=unclassified Nocardioides TaxID=2615069 RepID=UPI00360936EE
MSVRSSRRSEGRRALIALPLSLAVGVLSLLTVLVAPPAVAATELSHVAAASDAGNRSNHRVTIPAEVQAGDRLVLFLTWNSNTTATTPAGWSQLEVLDLSRFGAAAWTRVADGSDADSTVTIPMAARTKGVASVVAYRSTGATVPVTASAVDGTQGSATDHTTPVVPVVDEGSWLVSVWGEKSGSAQTWTLPAGATARTSDTNSGGGKISMEVADSGGPVTVGDAGGLTATTSSSVNRASLFSVVVSPGTEDATPNTPPTASFTHSCTELACDFDASASQDDDGDQLSYSWDFGDGNTGSGVSPSHTYADGGTWSVTLTVSDGTDSDSASDDVSVTGPPTGPGTDQPVPGHSGLVPERPNTSMPRITDGEIWDIEVMGDRAYVAGTFGSAINVAGNGARIQQPKLLAFDLNTGLIDLGFRPTFTGGGAGVLAVEASPDHERLFVVGSFNQVNGVTKRKIAELDPATGAPVASFQANANSRVTALEVSDDYLYVGGRFSRIGGVDLVGLAALDADTGDTDTGFDNQLAGGIGVNGVIQVQQLRLTHDNTKLLVVHTARRIDGQNRYGVGLIDTATKQLLPWRTRLWEDNLQNVGGVQRIYPGDISPDDSYFVVGSGGGGDRPPINDTGIAFPIDAVGPDVQPLWISRAFDSIYSIAITEVAVYIGGHMQWAESPTAPDPWPGLDNVGYGTGQGLSAYALGDTVVRRDHLAALTPEDGFAMEWHPGSNSFEGNKAMIATPHGLITGGDAGRQGGEPVGRVAFFDFDDLPAPSNPDTTIDTPIQGRVLATGEEHIFTGTATAANGVNRVAVEIKHASANQYLQDDMQSWGSFNTINAELGTPSGGVTPWTLPVTIPDARELIVRARTFQNGGGRDPVKAEKKLESYNYEDLTPNTRIDSPRTTLQESTSWVMRGTATDDKGVDAVLIYLFDQDARQYLTPDGTMVDAFTTHRIQPDVVGAVDTTWRFDVDLPHEGEWKIGALAIDTIGQPDARWARREYTVSSTGQTPVVTMNAPVTVNPPIRPTLTMEPGTRPTFSGTVTDDTNVTIVEVIWRNTTTRENMSADGTWGSDVQLGWDIISPPGTNSPTVNWTWTPPADLVPGNYDLLVRGIDDTGLSSPSSTRLWVKIYVTVPGDAEPNALIDLPGNQTSDVLRLDLTGTATDDNGVDRVMVAIDENDTDRYLQPDGSLDPAFATLDAVLGTPGGTSTTWSLSVDLPMNGDYSVTVYAVDTVGQWDLSTSGATARYSVYPGDPLPWLWPELASPNDGDSFTESRIVVTGRAEDDTSIAEVEIAIVNEAGEYMSSSGSFSSSERWVNAFLTSAGSPGSNYSYTSPVINDGTYVVRVRPVDHHGLYPDSPREVTVTVSSPAANNPPVAVGTVACTENQCTFDGRGSTDETASTLDYAWSFGDGRGGSDALEEHFFTFEGTFTPELTVTDEYGISSTVTLDPVTITQPPGNAAPDAVITPPTCWGLTCSFSGATSTDPDEGDSLGYAWDFGDGVGTSTSSSPSWTFAAGGTYTVTLTVTDGWGNADTATVTVTVSP